MSLATSPAMAVGVRVLGHAGTEKTQTKTVQVPLQALTLAFPPHPSPLSIYFNNPM